MYDCCFFRAVVVVFVSIVLVFVVFFVFVGLFDVRLVVIVVIVVVIVIVVIVIELLLVTIVSDVAALWPKAEIDPLGPCCVVPRAAPEHAREQGYSNGHKDERDETLHEVRDSRVGAAEWAESAWRTAVRLPLVIWSRWEVGDWRGTGGRGHGGEGGVVDHCEIGAAVAWWPRGRAEGVEGEREPLWNGVEVED